MARLRILFARLRGFFSTKRADRELNDEIRAHLEMLEEENRRKGMSAEEARNAARREFGGIEQMKETYRETNGLRFLETLLQDLRYALRMLRRNPGFAATVIVLLALGIGANTAIFSAIDAVILRLLPVKDPQQLVMLQWSSREFPEDFVGDIEGGGRHHGSGGPSDFGGAVVAYSTFTEIRERNHVFSDTFGFAGNNERVNVGLNNHAESAVLQGVSGNYFQGVEVPAALGRTILPEDDQESAPPVAVLSYKFWQQKLGGERSIVDKTIVMNGSPITIVGVAPPEFFGVQPGIVPDFWIPLHLYSRQQELLGNANDGVPFLKDPKTWWVQIIGRLRPGISESQASAELALLFQQSLKTYAPAAPLDKFPRLELINVKRGLDSLRSQYSTSLLLLISMAGVVLLIACGNVAGLLLTRANARQKEIAVRLSLGARRGRLIRQLLTESVILATLGGGAALLFTLWANSALSALLFNSYLTVEMHINGTVLAFTSALSLASGILFGLAPAFRATRVPPLAVLKPGNSAVGIRGRRFTPGKFLTGAQVALSLMLLIAAGLLLGTLRDLKNLDLGFDRQHLLLFNVAPGLNGYSDLRLGEYYRELQRRIEAVPGVHSASFATRAPVGEGLGSTSGIIPGYMPPDTPAKLYRHVIGPKYFDTFRIPLVLGRVIEEKDDQSAPLVIVINRKASQMYFHGDNPIGHRIIISPGNPRERIYEVIGVAQDVKFGGLRNEILPTAYFPYLQYNNISKWMTFEVRAEGDLGSLTSAIRREALALDRNVPLVSMKTQDEVVNEMLVLERTFAALSTSFAVLALLLACVGLYGTMAYAIARRTNEIGIRMALGAKRETILGMVLRETLVVVLAGLMVGFPLAWFATSVLKSQLFGLSAHDPATILLATAALVAVTAVAGYLPARRASQVDPMVALRYE